MSREIERGGDSDARGRRTSPRTRTRSARDRNGSDNNARRLLDALAFYRSEARAEAEQRLDALHHLAETAAALEEFDQGPIGYVTHDEKGVINSVNHAASYLLGRPRQHLFGKLCVLQVHRPDRPTFVTHLLRCASDRGPLICDLRLRPTPGDPARHVRLLTKQLAHTVDGAPTYCTAIVDLSGLKETEQEARRSERRYRTVAEVAAEGVWMLDQDGCIQFANRQMAQMLGVAVGELVGRRASDFMPDDTGQTGWSAPDGRREEVRLRRANGELTWANRTTARIRADDGDAERVIAMYTDTSHQRNLDERRTRLLRQLVDAQEEERRRVSRELHDQLGQQLTVLTLWLKRLEEHADDEAARAALIQGLQELAHRIGREVHALAKGLRPAALDDLGLASALKSLTSDFSSLAQIDIQIHCGGLETPRLPSFIETTVYRIVQEALTNVAKHARARTVSVIVERRPDVISIVVEDDGVGFDVGAQQPDVKSLGLKGIQERASLLDGTAHIESKPGRGTAIFVRLPVQQGG